MPKELTKRVAEMIRKNQNFSNSLRCLQHPATLLSIALLLINDHVLKAIGPAWLTGKLSDFAGLFFFPFIIAAGLSLFSYKFKVKRQQIGQVAFVIAILWFALLKTIQPINSFTTQFASLLVGFPTKFILDPTDIVALIAMLPAWIIWMQPGPIRSTRLGFAALLLASCAAIATSPPFYGITKITNLEYYRDGIVFAADKQISKDENSNPVAKSLDGGITWNQDQDGNIEEKGLPIKHCSRLHPNICYKLTTAGKLQELASDGTWVNEKGVSKIQVYDLIIFEWQGKEYALIAIGEYGIRRRELPDGQWDEISVLGAGK